MQPKGAQRERILPLVDRGLETGADLAAAVTAAHRESLVPAADIHGTATFYTLLDGAPKTRVCQGLSCQLAGAAELADELRAEGEQVELVSCLGQCDRPPAALDPHLEVYGERPRGAVTPDDPDLPLNLAGADRDDYAALARAVELGPDAVLAALDESGLQGRGGAGFPAGRKWRSVLAQTERERYVVCNADEAEPGTFKDREVMLRRPHLLLEGLAIAARVVEASDIYIYVRGEFTAEQRSLKAALAAVADDPLLAGLRFEVVSGHGAYICGEETALLESLEGRRGMPRLKPPYPTVSGFRGKPTLINNVETLALVPAIVQRGGAWFRDLGRDEPGTKLYCLSGHVARPGVYELPLGVTLDELVEAGGGYVGTPIAFSPGGASSGFLPIRCRDVPLAFKSLAKTGSMLGSAGVVVLNDTVDLVQAALSQAVFFEDESCGQCAPCRIGARLLRRALDTYTETKDPAALASVEDVAWEMVEGSICGLGFTAPLPLTSAIKHFPEAFGRPREEGS
jgi:NADH:ubiquinone oxidoreductase subunit F (NADH-binding)